MDLGLGGRRVLITGASRGIGAGIARAFAREGSDLVLVARSGDALVALRDEVRDAYDVSVDLLAVDLTEPGAIERVMTLGQEADVLVNNAGSIPAGTLWDVDEVAWRHGWELKVFGFINLTRAIYPVMKARGAGVIVNNIGIGGENYDFDYIAGTTGNAALMGFTRALGGRSLSDGIRVVGVNPGPVATERVSNLLKRRAERTLGDSDRTGELLAGYPLGRAATVEEIADLFVFLASDRSSYTSGTVVTVDGGICSNNSLL